MQFSSLFSPTEITKREIRNQEACEDFISRLHALLHQLILNDKTKINLALFLHCEGFV